MLLKVLLIAAAITILTTMLSYLSPSSLSQDKPVDGIAVLADHGQEITLTLYNSSFGSLTSGGGNQVNIFANYKLNDDSIAGQTINAVMEVYAPNGTLIRTSSYPNGFIAQSTDGIEGLKTTIKDPTLQSVTANVTFMSADKTAVLSNNLRVNLNLGQEGTPALATTGEDAAATKEGVLVEESEQEQAPGPFQKPDQQGNGGEDTEEEDEDGEQQELPLPLFGNE